MFVDTYLTVAAARNAALAAKVLASLSLATIAARIAAARKA